MTALSLAAIQRLARRYTPRPARYEPRLVGEDWWGPAHEIGHALVATRADRALRDYGLPCAAGFCRCPYERCHVYELAAMAVSARLVCNAGRPDVATREVEDTSDYDLMIHRGTVRAAERLLTQRKLQRLPRTIEGLERLLRWRLA